MSKRGKGHKRWGVENALNAKICFVKARVKIKFINKKKHQYFLHFENNLLVNILKGAMFS